MVKQRDITEYRPSNSFHILIGLIAQEGQVHHVVEPPVRCKGPASVVASYPGKWYYAQVPVFLDLDVVPWINLNALGLYKGYKERRLNDRRSEFPVIERREQCSLADKPHVLLQVR